MSGRSLAHKHHSFQPLIAIVAVIAMPNLLSFSVRETPLLAQLVPSIKSDYLYLLLRVISLTLITACIAVWWAGLSATLRRLMITAVSLTTYILITALLALVRNISTYGPDEATALMVDGLVVWMMTVLIFSIWCWLIDCGWPELQGGTGTKCHEFLFAQQGNRVSGWEG